MFSKLITNNTQKLIFLFVCFLKKMASLLHDSLLKHYILCSVKLVGFPGRLNQTFVYHKNKMNIAVILLDEVDRLTKDAQHALRRTMEKYISTCRLILSANSISQVIPAIRSRCLGIRVAAPTHQEVITILQVCTKQRLSSSFGSDN